MKSRIILFCVIAFGITWVIGFIISYFNSNGLISNQELDLFHSIASTGPTFAAIVACLVYDGSAGLNRLIKKFKLSNFGSLIIAISLSPLLFLLIGLIVFRIIHGTWFDFQRFFSVYPNFTDKLIWFLPLISYAIFEEIGWRGYLLPAFQKNNSAWKSTIYLTIIWALWHIPFFFYRFEFSILISIGFFFGMFVGSIILTYLVNSAKGLLWAAILFHFLNNLCSSFEKEIVVSVLSTGFIFIAIFIVGKFGRNNLSPEERSKLNE